MSAIIWSPESEVDLQEIYEFIALNSEFYAANQIQEIIDRVELLLEQPYSGRVVPEANSETIREVFEGNYRIIYHIGHLPDVQILHVRHFARRLKF